MASRKWCFTSYDVNWSPLVAGERLRDGVTYASWQLERCPDSGRLHIQGYVQLDKIRRLGAVKKLLDNPGLHLEEQRGSNSEAREYTRKEESRVEGPWEAGLFTASAGQRNDLGAVTAELRRGASIREVALEYSSIYVKYHKGIEKLHEHINADIERDWKTEVWVFWSEQSGTGKSHTVREMAPGAYWKPDNEKWWDKFDSTYEDVVLDDFDPSKYDRTFLLKLLDKYPMQVQNKGGYQKFLVKRLFITTNFPPFDCIGIKGFTKGWVDEYLARRIEHVIHRPDVHIVHPV